ncbi:MAG: hypothetical protein OER43_10050 [Gammaproteobacteria bacterium]|nr:hypothetical protein [Gammaproteobacteria bacterium]MDH3412496.1 hypothetical protein [Gammaproteobacteria bacterium]
MPDVYNTITSAEPALVQRIAQALEVRGADEQQKKVCWALTWRRLNFQPMHES